MADRLYKFSFFLNALHYMNIEDGSGDIHPHTWQLNLYLNKNTNDFIKFTEIEKKIQSYLSKYEGEVLNKIKPFDYIEPSMESIGEVIFYDVNKFLDIHRWKIDSLEISENSTRTYVIRNSIDKQDNAFFYNTENNNKTNTLQIVKEKKDIDVEKHENMNISKETVKKKRNAYLKKSLLAKIMEKMKE